MKLLNKNEAFTLVELIAVIVILGILLLIAIPSASRIVDNAKEEAFKKQALFLINSAKTLDIVEEGKNAEVYDLMQLVDLEKISNGKFKDYIGNVIKDCDDSGECKYYIYLANLSTKQVLEPSYPVSRTKPFYICEDMINSTSVKLVDDSGYLTLNQTTVNTIGADATLICNTESKSLTNVINDFPYISLEIKKGLNLKKIYKDDYYPYNILFDENDSFKYVIPKMVFRSKDYNKSLKINEFKEVSDKLVGCKTGCINMLNELGLDKNSVIIFSKNDLERISSKMLSLLIKLKHMGLKEGDKIWLADDDTKCQVNGTYKRLKKPCYIATLNNNEIKINTASDSDIAYYIPIFKIPKE